MTIGIAAAGPGAAAAIVAALAAAEGFSSGAIGGFVSLAAIAGNRVERAEVQAGGVARLFPDSRPDWLTSTRCAVLMSSGPNRPAPLDQFTPGHAAIGLVTGHRFPNMPDTLGSPLNRAALELIGTGLAPQAAVDQVANANPEADAGLLAVTPDGRVGMRDCAYLDQFVDRGQAMLSGSAGTVAVTHNGIAPFRGLALTIAEIALQHLGGAVTDLARIEVCAGIPLRLAPQNAVEVNASGRAVALWVRNPILLHGTRSFGLGYQAAVMGTDRHHLQYEPYMVSENGVLISIDGARSAWLALAR